MSYEQACLICLSCGLTIGAATQLLWLRFMYSSRAADDLRAKIRYYEESIRRCRELKAEHDEIIKDLGSSRGDVAALAASRLTRKGRI